jgi:hypothetical protein
MARTKNRIGQHVVLAVIDERGQLQPRANVNRRTRDVEFARDSSVEGDGFELPVREHFSFVFGENDLEG